MYLEFKENKEYLTEESLGEFLNLYFQGQSIISNKKYSSVTLPNSAFRPDYYLPELKLVVEFDGPRHYQTPSTIQNDLLKQVMYVNDGINFVSIPYFIQLDSTVIERKFSKFHKEPITTNNFTSFPIGFIKKPIILPGEFCSLGIKRFEQDLDDLFTNYDEHGQHLFKSLFEQIDIKTSLLQVFPVFYKDLYNSMVKQFTFADSTIKQQYTMWEKILEA